MKESLACRVCLSFNSLNANDAFISKTNKKTSESDQWLHSYTNLTPLTICAERLLPMNSDVQFASALKSRFWMLYRLRLEHRVDYYWQIVICRMHFFSNWQKVLQETTRNHIHIIFWGIHLFIFYYSTHCRMMN